MTAEAEATPADLATLSGGEVRRFVADSRFAERISALPEKAAVPFAALATQSMRHAVPASPVPASAEAPAVLDPVAAARAQGYAEGAEAAMQSARAEAADHLAALERLRLSFARLDAEMAERFRQKLMDMVVALCESCLAPLALDTTALAARVERAVAMFARADDDTLIRLHPADLEALQGLLPEDWACAPDAKLERGALRVETRSRGIEGGGVEDGPEQWRRAIAEALDLGVPG